MGGDETPRHVQVLRSQFEQLSSTNPESLKHGKQHKVPPALPERPSKQSTAVSAVPGSPQIPIDLVKTGPSIDLVKTGSSIDLVKAVSSIDLVNTGLLTGLVKASPDFRQQLPPPKLPPRGWNRSPSPVPNIPGAAGGLDYECSGDSGFEDTSLPPPGTIPDASEYNHAAPIVHNRVSEYMFGGQIKAIDVKGRYLCACSDSAVSVWDLVDGQLFGSTSLPAAKFTAVVFKRSTVVGDVSLWLGQKDGTLYELDMERKTETKRSDIHKCPVVSLLYSGLHMLSLDEQGNVRVWTCSNRAAAVSLSDPPASFRVSGRAQCAIVADGILWVGHGRTVAAYDPFATSQMKFTLTPKPLVSNKLVGQITSVAVLHLLDDRVFFGHGDGKVSVFSKSKYKCEQVVNVSNNKIQSLTCTGMYLWIALENGHIAVFDVLQKPWKLLKDFQGHKEPIMVIHSDPTGIIRTGALQLISASQSGHIRAWDGMLFDDWLARRMLQRDRDYCTFSPVSIFIFTWNAGASHPEDLRDSRNPVTLDSILQTAGHPDVVVFNFQELVDLEDKTLTAKSIFLGSKKDTKVQEQLSSPCRIWQKEVSRVIETHKGGYVLLHTVDLVGLFTCVFIKSSLATRVSMLHVGSVKTGLGGLHGNKGAVMIRLLIDQTSICFVNCHLAAGQDNNSGRSNDLAEVIDTESFPRELNTIIKNNSFLGGGDGSIVLDHELCFLSGDLNYRIKLSRDLVTRHLRAGDINKMLAFDQLVLEKAQNPSLKIRSFGEGPITFLPTYKYDPYSDRFDSGPKHRIPGWCDRILFRGRSFQIEQTSYKRHDIRTSDHRPVTATFNVHVKRIDDGKKKSIFEEVVKEWEQLVRQSKESIKLRYVDTGQST